MIIRTMLAITTIVCFYLFFAYESYNITKQQRVLVVEAKASVLQNGRLNGAFIIYREMHDSIVTGEPVTMLVDDEQYKKAALGDCKVEYIRSQFTYIMFVLGTMTLFLWFMSVQYFYNGFRYGDKK